MRKWLAALFVVLSVGGLMVVAPAASADPILKYATEGEVDPDRIGNSDHLVCLDPYLRLFGNVVLDEEICI